LQSEDLNEVSKLIGQKNEDAYRRQERRENPENISKLEDHQKETGHKN
jgi:hypothetical protein